MTRRLTVTIVGIVVATLVLVGGGTLLVAQVRARATTAKELRSQASDLAVAVTETLTAGLDDTSTDAEVNTTVTRRLAVLRRFDRVLELDDVGVVVVGRRGLLTDPPTPIARADVDIEALRSGEAVSGHVGDSVWAAAPTPTGRNGRFVAVFLVRQATRGIGAAFRWFVLAAAITVALGVLAAVALGRRLARPVADASRTAHRIAAGDLSARMAAPTGDEELDELARSINSMAEELERSRGLEQEFLLSVSHDLRTPLTSIRGYAEAIVDRTGPPERAATVILSEARRLERLVADLLDLAKLQSSAFRFENVSLDLSQVVRAAVAGFEPTADERELAVVTGRLDVAWVVADRDRLGQVLANLVENAAKYAQARVEVSSIATNLGAWIVVDDDGPGIAPEDLPHVFDRLYVARSAPRRRENSSGLGLAIVRGLVTGMGGTISAEASPLGGARFLVSLPLGRGSDIALR